MLEQELINLVLAFDDHKIHESAPQTRISLVAVPSSDPEKFIDFSQRSCFYFR